MAISSNIVSYNSDHSYYALSNASRGYNSSENTQYASMNLTRGNGAQSYMYWQFSLPTIPDGSTINSITCNYKARTSSSSTSYIASAYIQMCSNLTAKGTAKSILTTSTNASSFTSTQIGTWTVAQINAGVSLKTYATRGTSRTTSNYYIYFYGADIEITYTEPVNKDKIYIKANGVWKESSDILVKVNGDWESVADVYKKVNNSWTKQQDISSLFDVNAKFTRSPFVDYVYDNCVMNLDGIVSQQNKVSDEYLWLDCIDTAMHMNDIVCDGESFELNGTSSYLRPAASTTFDTFLYNTHTIEIVFTPYSYDTSNDYRTTLYVGRASNNIAMYLYQLNGSYYIIHSSTTATKLIPVATLPAVNTAHYIALNANGCLIDNTYIPASSFSSTTNSVALNTDQVVSGTYTCASIGCRLRSGIVQALHGKIYAVRIHDALLTQADMINNRDQDRIRFNI